MTNLRCLLSVLVSITSVSIAADAVVFDLGSLKDFVDPAGWTTAGSVEAKASGESWVKVADGTGLLINGKQGKAGDLVSRIKVGDVEAEIEFMVPRGSNSGIYFQERYEIQILDSFGKTKENLGVHDCGAIYERWDEKRNPKGYEGKAPDQNASKAPGEWQTFKIVFRAPRFDAAGKKTENARFVKVEHNGVLIHENVAVTGPTRGGKSKEAAKGSLRIQGDHGPVAIRKISLTPMKL